MKSVDMTVLVWSILMQWKQGFGVTSRSTAEARRLDPTGIVVFRQADVGEYLREEDTLFTTT